MKKSKNYINNADLLRELTLYREEYLKGNKPQMSNYIGQAILLIAERLSNKSNFFGYSYKDEMIQDAVENCCKYLHNFNPEKTTNAFAYITQIIYNTFLSRIEEENTQLYIKLKNTERYLFENEIIDFHLRNGEDNTIYENNKLFIAKFEKKLAEKKAKNKKPVTGVEQFYED